MAVVFYMPEGGADDTPPSSGNNSTASSNTGSPASSTSQSPNTTTSATQTPMQSPLVPTPQLMWAMYDAMLRMNSAPAFQYPPPSPNPYCSMFSPPPATGEVFFPRSRSTPRTPRTSVSYAPGEDVSFQAHNTSSSSNSQQQQQQPPLSAPPMHSHSHPQFQPMPYTFFHQYTPPATPHAVNCSNNMNNSCMSSTPGIPMMTSTAAAASTSSQIRVKRTDAQRRPRRASHHEPEHECHSEHETSWDELDDRYENFSAGRERLQEFNGRIPPRKKKNKDVPKSKPDMKLKFIIWPTVVTAFVVAIVGCGFLVAR